MDQGAFRSLKAKYRTKVVQMMTDAISDDKPLPIISINETLKTLLLAWDDVSTTAVQTLLQKRWFFWPGKRRLPTIHFLHWNIPSNSFNLKMKLGFLMMYCVVIHTFDNEEVATQYSNWRDDCCRNASWWIRYKRGRGKWTWTGNWRVAYEETECITNMWSPKFVI